MNAPILGEYRKVSEGAAVVRVLFYPSWVVVEAGTYHTESEIYFAVLPFRT